MFFISTGSLVGSDVFFFLRGLKVAQSLGNKQVKVECAVILEGLKVRTYVSDGE